MPVFEDDFHVIPTSPEAEGPGKKIIRLGDQFEPFASFEIESSDPLDPNKRNPLSPYDTVKVHDELVSGVDKLRRDRAEMIYAKGREKMVLYVGAFAVDTFVAIANLDTTIYEASPDFNWAGYGSMTAAVIALAGIGSRLVERNWRPKLKNNEARISRMQRYVDWLKGSAHQDVIEGYNTPAEVEIEQSLRPQLTETATAQQGFAAMDPKEQMSVVRLRSGQMDRSKRRPALSPYRKTQTRPAAGQTQARCLAS